LGAVKVLQQSISALKKADSASVVFFSTVAVQTGLSFHTSVASAKGALEGLTKSLACELAPKVRVNAIAPSLTDTPLASSLLSSDEKREANAKRHPLKKLGTTEDIANAAEFLLTDRSSWVTGQIINVDGGLGSLR
jgi:NAD(P)-dependent dehydrogenase (short-subunit alcohol dehydrogenase family)